MAAERLDGIAKKQKVSGRRRKQMVSSVAIHLREAIHRCAVANDVSPSRVITVLLEEALLARGFSLVRDAPATAKSGVAIGRSASQGE